MACEILGKAQIRINEVSCELVCQALRTFAEVSALWKPKFGIYCDDLIAIAESDGKKLLFLTEVKATTLQQGLSRSSEAKIFYQLARTCDALSKRMPFESSLRLGGAITMVIIHSQKTITLNVLDETATLGFFPDQWMYGSQKT